MHHVRDLKQGGLSEAELKRMRKELDHLTWGTYAPKGLEGKERYVLKCLAVQERLKQGAALAGPSAATLWGIPMLGDPPDLVYVRNITRGSYAKDVRLMPDGETVLHNGILLTTPASTIADCARVMTSRDALVVADGTLAGGLCTLEQLHEVAADSRGRRGAARVRWVANNADPLSESPGETWTRHNATQLGYDVVSQFHVVTDDGEAWLDFLVKDTKVALEFDGVVKYVKKTVHKVVAERLRQGDLEEMGYGFVRFLHRQLDNLKQFDRRLRSAGAQPVRRPKFLTW